MAMLIFNRIIIYKAAQNDLSRKRHMTESAVTATGVTSVNMTESAVTVTSVTSVNLPEVALQLHKSNSVNFVAIPGPKADARFLSIGTDLLCSSPGYHHTALAAVPGFFRKLWLLPACPSGTPSSSYLIW